jgi:hypothetical protein
MAGTLAELIVVGLLILAGVSCIVGPVAVLGFISWQWRKELVASARLRQARSTQVR